MKINRAIGRSLLLVMCAGLPFSAMGQPSDDVLRVQRVTDVQPDRPFGDAILLESAFEPAMAGAAAEKSFEIVGMTVPDIGNLPGRVDPRPRVSADNATLKFLDIELAVPPPKIRKDWMLSHHINVGQGNATLLEFSCGLVLVDTGGQKTDQFDGTRRLVDYLAKVFARRPDLNRTIKTIFLTHPHKDHTAGITSLLAMSPQLAIGGVVANGRTNGSGWNEQRRLIEFANAKSIPVTIVANESITRSDGRTDAQIDALACTGVDPEIRVLWGSDSGSHAWGNEANNNSVVVRVDFGESSFLFTGDLEDSAQDEFVGSYIRNPDIIDADVYQVGHHGSRNGTTEALLKVLKPEIAVIGAGNPGAEEPGFSAYNFAHPNQVAIQLLSDSQFGVTMTRPPVTVPVGVKGKAPGRNSPPPTYVQQEVSKAIFSTGWDGDIVIAASAAGQKEIQVH